MLIIDLMIEIRTLGEMPSLAPILAYWAYGEWYRSRPLDFYTVLKAYRSRAAGSDASRILIALVDTLPAGMVSLRERDLFSRPDLSPWLSSLYVAPDMRCRGIGSALIENLCERSKTLGYARLFLFLNHGHALTLKDYYMKRGWSFSGVAPDNDGNDTDIMQKQLV